MQIGTAFIAILLVICSANTNGYTEESINLLVRTDATKPFRRFCVELAKLPNNRTVNVSQFGWYRPYFAARAVNACSINDLQTLIQPSSLPSNTMLVLYDSQCKITEHAWNVQQVFGANISLMIVTPRTNTRYILTLNVSAMPVSIPTLIFWQNDFDRLTKWISTEKNVEFSLDLPPVSVRKFRPATLLMFALVFFVLLAGNFWAADEFQNRIREHHAKEIDQSPTSAPAALKQNSIEPKEPAVIPITYCLIVFLLIFAVGWLLLIYYFPKVMIYILQVMFCIGAFSSLSSCLDRLSKFVPLFRRFRTPPHQCQRPCHCHFGPMNVSTMISMAIALATVIIWYIYRREEWSWILQDVLGAAVCIAITSIYRLGNMRVITLILLGFFLYDIFFVFVTPYIPIFQASAPSTAASNSTGSLPGSSSSGSSTAHSTNVKPSKTPSVMEQVALGFGTNGEVVPLLFALPMFIPEAELDPCLAARKSMLGFGDVILPGILLTFCKLFDIASGNRWPIYYVQSVISYFIGLTLTHIALNLMNTAQPALLYLVPCLLLSTIITGLCRGELKELYTGRRLQLLLEGKDQRSSPSLLQGIDNPQAAQLQDELPASEKMSNGQDLNP